MKPLLEVLREVSLDPTERAAFTADPAHYLEQHGYGGVPVEHLGDAFDLMHDTLPAETAHHLATHPVLDVPAPDHDPLAGHVAGEHTAFDAGHAVEGHAAEVGDIAPFGEVTSDFDAPDDHGHGHAGHGADHHDGTHLSDDGAGHGLSHDPGGDAGHDLRTHDLHALRDLGPHDSAFDDVDTGFGHGDHAGQHPPTIGDGYGHHIDHLDTDDGADGGFGHGVAGHPGETADHGLHTGADVGHDVGAAFGAGLHDHHDPQDLHTTHDAGHDLGSDEPGDHGLHSSGLHGSELHGADHLHSDLGPDHLHPGDDPGHHGHDPLHDVHDIGLF